jgi:hypothetical protein
VAVARHDSSDALASALLRVGCKDVVELDRGSHHPSFVHRAGGTTPPMASYETSVLYALGRPMLARAFRWKAEGAAPSTKVTSYDVGHRSAEDEPNRKKRKRERERDRDGAPSGEPTQKPEKSAARAEANEPGPR